MPIDRDGAARFIWSAARLVDRHRYTMLFEGGPAEPVLAALAAYRNPDGGFGHALEPDLRCPASQPAAVLGALEMLGEAGALDGELARGARSWIASIAQADGGVPSLLPGYEAYPRSPWWTPEPGSVLTFALAAALHAGGAPPEGWLERATAWCWRALEEREPGGGYWLKFGCAFLDAVPDEERARHAFAVLAASGVAERLAPPGGAEGETLRPLDISPRPGCRSRALFEPAAIEAHLDAVAAGQREDGGWMFDWLAWSPEQTTAWRGIVTTRALLWLAENGRLAGAAGTGEGM